MHFIVHRPLRGSGIYVQEMLDKTLREANEIGNLKLISSFTYEDAANYKHLYLIFEQLDEKEENQKSR